MDIETLLLILWVLLGVLSLSLVILVTYLLVKKKQYVDYTTRVPLKESDIINEMQMENTESLPQINDELKEELENKVEEYNLQETEIKEDLNFEENKVEEKVQQDPKKIDKKHNKYVPLPMDLENTSVTFGNMRFRDNTRDELLNPIIKDIKPLKKETPEVEEIDEEEEIEIIDV